MSNLSQVWDHIQTTLFPFLEEHLDPLTEKQKTLASILEMIRIEDFIPGRWWFLGRPTLDRTALAKAFVAKMVYGRPITAAREKPAAKPPKPPQAEAKRGRPRRGEPRPATEPVRLERQAAMSLDELLADLP